MNAVYGVNFIIMCIFAVQLAFAQNKSNLDSCKLSLDISAPKQDNESLGCETNVEGNARLQTNQYLWILCHRTEGFEDMWWPQNEAKIDPKNNTWKCHVVFGGKQDTGYEFEIAAIIVNETNHVILKAYRKNAMKTGDWRPIEMPETMAPPIIRKIRKISHDGCN